MSELRRDPLRGNWVIIAPSRNERPDTARRLLQSPNGAGTCPFCPGHEAQTPPQVGAVRADGTPTTDSDWSVRIVPNKYPALVSANAAAAGPWPLRKHLPAAGVHEVVVAAPGHEQRAAELDARHWQLLLGVCQRRMQELMADAAVQHVVLFQNHGFAGGASLSHAHLQLMAMPVTLDRVFEEIRLAQDYHLQHARCLSCDILGDELAEGARVVQADDGFVSLAPWASRTPYEVLLLPRVHRASFLEVPAEELGRLAVHLQRLYRRADAVLGDFPHNLVLHTVPRIDGVDAAVHWRLELLPRLMHLAGYEWGTGGYINPVAPEEAAAELRQAGGDVS